MLTEFAKYLTQLGASGPLNPVDSLALVLPEDCHVVSTEKMGLGRQRARYQMVTPSVTAFIDYVNARETTLDLTPIVSVDPEDCTALAIMNAHTDVTGYAAGHGDDTAQCVLVMSPAYRWLSLLAAQPSGGRVNQREAIDMVRDWHEVIPNALELVNRLSLLTVDNLRQRSQGEGDFAREHTAMEKIEMRAAGGEVPGEIVVNVVPYMGFSERQVVIGLSALLNNDDVVLRLRVRNFEGHKEAIAMEFAERLSAELDTAPIIGTVRVA